MKTDVAIIGGGPAGSAAAMRLARRGIDTVIVEKVPFPRFHIGESLTAEAGERLRDLGFEPQMVANGHAVKHGVNVYGSSSHTWFVPIMRRTPADELEDRTTWQVRRSTFDSMLYDEALASGATAVPGKALRPLHTDDGAVRGVRVRSDEGEFDLEAAITLDCSGQATFLASQGVTGSKYLGAYDKQIAIFSQVTGLERNVAEPGLRHTIPGNTMIFYKQKYHWAWAIPLDDETTSVGIVVPAQYFIDTGETKEQFYRRELHELHPGLGRRLPEIEIVEDVHVIPNYSFQVSRFAGKAFICVADAHRFVDPIFSFGVDVALHESQFATETIVRYLEGEGRDSDDLFREHMVRCERRTDVFEDLIDAFWENPLGFAVFAHSRYRESIIDLFAGRNHGVNGVEGALGAFRKILARTRLYDGDDISIPIGSRFHPERQELWNSVLDSVETTERWMREH